MSDLLIKNNYPDKYGYYQIGNVRTYSKVELMELYYRLPQHWQWKYNDEFFSSYDWAKEPEESIEELYKKRALQLRRDYDYLIVYYSGGYDSTNLLYTFLENNIPVDEVCVYYSKEDRISNQYIELNTLTWDKVAFLKQKYPDLNVRTIDYTKHFFNWDQPLTDLGYKHDLLDMFGNMLTINRLVQDLFHITVDDWSKLLEQGKRVAWIYGADKPMIRFINGKWIFNFHDGIMQARVTPMRQIIDNGSIGDYEMFYWSPTHECAQILIKQCHLLKKLYNQRALTDFSQIPEHKPFKPGYGWEVDTMSTPFVRAIYPRNFKYSENFYTVKNPQHIFGNRDQWFFESNHEKAKLHKDMYMATHSMNYSHFHHWFNDGKTIHSGIKNCISKDYVF